MKITVVKGAELTAADLERWRTLQAANPDLASPYFCPEYTQAVAAVRKDIFVGVMEADGQVVGYFPHQRRSLGFGGPPGGGFSDFQGVIAAPTTTWDARDLLRGCGLVSWEFNDLVASQAPFAAYHARKEDSHYVDVSAGFDAYLESLRGGGSSQTKKVRAMLRKAESTFPRVEFVPHVHDKKMLAQLLEWKSRQYRESGLRDIFSFPWTVELLNRILDVQTESFAGMFSVLYFGDKPAAMHMGMRSKTVLHWWFPRHDNEFEKHSPGIQLLMRAAQAAPGIGLKRIDLSSGEEDYKLRLRSGGIPVAAGRVEVPSVAMSLLKFREATESWVRKSPLLGIARGPGRILKAIERWNEFR